MSIQNTSSVHFQDYNHIHSSHYSSLGQGEENDDDNGEIFGVILGRRMSPKIFHGLLRCERQSTSMLDNAVRKTVSMRAVEKQNSSSALESSFAVRRAFSMRATPAVSQAYCRMDNEYDSVSDMENLLTPKAQEQAQNTVFNNNKKGNKFFQVCRRFFCLKN